MSWSMQYVFSVLSVIEHLQYFGIFLHSYFTGLSHFRKRLSPLNDKLCYCFSQTHIFCFHFLINKKPRVPSTEITFENIYYGKHIQSLSHLLPIGVSYLTFRQCRCLLIQFSNFKNMVESLKYTRELVRENPHFSLEEILCAGSAVASLVFHSLLWWSSAITTPKALTVSSLIGGMHGGCAWFTPYAVVTCLDLLHLNLHNNDKQT